MDSRFARWTFFAALAGTLAGISATIFLYLLDWATHFRMQHFDIVWGLPVAGLAIGWAFHKYGKDIQPGNNLILDEIHNPKKTVPFRMAPFILIGTVATHLFGGSAGREGTAVQMGASLADQINKYFKIGNEERRILLMAGMGAGFGAAIGAPFAGAIFGMEVLTQGRLRLVAAWECLVGSLFGYAMTIFLRAPHTIYPHVHVPDFSIKQLGGVVLIGIASGVFARGFISLTHLVEYLETKWIKNPIVKPFLAGLVLLALFQIPELRMYAGLGIDVIQGALNEPSKIDVPFWKAGFTALTIGSGFKGGEFIPLVFMGTTLGSALAFYLGVSFQLMGAVGFASSFGAASKTPIACALMSVEIFGIEVAPYSLLGCFLAYYCSGSKSIYKTQKQDRKLWWASRGN
jgi:H+/Cl- antiporter ClcA